MNNRAAATREQQMGSGVEDDFPGRSPVKSGSIPDGPAEPLSDIQMTKLCADAMGKHVRAFEGNSIRHYWRTEPSCLIDYDPLEDDAQAMALLKRFPMDVFADRGNPFWRVRLADDHNKGYGLADDLNRAIVECVAMLQVDRTAQEAVTVAQQSKQDGAVEPTTQVLEG